MSFLPYWRTSYEPLAPIRSAVELLRQPEMNKSQLERIRNIIDRQVSHLVRLVNDLLDASRISRGKMTLTRSVLELNGLIADTVESIRSVGPQGHEFVILTAPDPIYVDADVVRLTQVFLNLLGNAVKFTPESGTISLSVKRVGDHVDIWIKDNGQGIPAEDLAHVFEMFYRGKDGGRRWTGLGPGADAGYSNWYRCRRQCARLCRAGNGQRVFGQAPVVAEAAMNAVARSSTPQENAGRRFWSSTTIAMLLRLWRSFRMEGNEVETVFDGDTAIKTVSMFSRYRSTGHWHADHRRDTAARTIRRDFNGGSRFWLR
jgi:hypothetical protein